MKRGARVDSGHSLEAVDGGLVRLDWEFTDVNSIQLGRLAQTEPRPFLESEAPRTTGVYALTYTGELPMLRKIADGKHPIYVGSASDLRRRMREHHDSLAYARNLDLEDFAVIFVETPTRPAALFVEALLIEELNPPWNSKGVEGFGSKPQGHLRSRGQTPTPWDRLHPGRPWVAAPADASSRQSALEALRDAVDAARALDWLLPRQQTPCAPVSHTHRSTRRRQTGAPRKGKGMASRRKGRTGEVLEYLRTRTGPASIQDVASELDLSHREARDTLAYLARAGHVSRVARGRYEAGHLSEAPAKGQRRPYGSVAKAVEDALRARPEKVWTAQDLAEEIGIAKNHATAILAKLTDRGVVGRVGLGRYRLGAETTWRGGAASASGWEPVGRVDGSILLRDAESNLWLASPASVSDLTQVA